MDYIIRLATAKDSVELSRLKQHVWNETYRGIYSDEKIDNYDFEKNREKYQRKGIGKRLFNIAANKIKESGYNEFFICCNKYNINAQEFYKKMGGIIDEIDDENIDKSIPQVKFIYKI